MNFKTFFAGILLFFIAACVTRIEKKGYVFEASDFELLQEGFSSQEQVLQLMGSPSFIDDFGEDESWVYFSEKIENFLFFKPKVLDRNVLVLRFRKNLLLKIEKIDHTNEVANLHFVDFYTEVKSEKVGFFKGLFSNVGQVKSQ